MSANPDMTCQDFRTNPWWGRGWVGCGWEGVYQQLLMLLYSYGLLLCIIIDYAGLLGNYFCDVIHIILVEMMIGCEVHVHL